MMHATQIKATDLTPMPWKNGGGVTREVAVWPVGAGLDAFIWRISLAEVAQSGPFSRFAGIDRILVLIDGHGMELADTHGDSTLLQQPGELLCFAGEAEIVSTLHHGTTHDFNLMWRRDQANGHAEIITTSQSMTISAGTHVLHAVSSAIDIQLSTTETKRLAAGDSLILNTEKPQAISIQKAESGLLIHAQITSK